MPSLLPTHFRALCGAFIDNLRFFVMVRFDAFCAHVCTIIAPCDLIQQRVNPVQCRHRLVIADVSLDC